MKSLQMKKKLAVLLLLTLVFDLVFQKTIFAEDLNYSGNPNDLSTQAGASSAQTPPGQVPLVPVGYSTSYETQFSGTPVLCNRLIVIVRGRFSSNI